MKKPNIVLMVVDQMRFDALGANGNPVISTPNLDMMAQQGYNFKQAYTAVPTCIPSRAALLTGLSQAHHGRVGYQDGVPWSYEITLGKELTKRGYQTQVVGKMNVYPERNRLGFEAVELHDGYLHASRNQKGTYQNQFVASDDYLRWFKEKKGSTADLIDDGLDCNSWVARPWLYEEELHPTNWVTSKSIEFLERRDSTLPFFLKMSYVRPHSPLNPPTYYFNLYQDLISEFNEIAIGKWAQELTQEASDSTIALKGRLKKRELDRMRAAYYGLITQIDHQIGRFLMALTEHRLDYETIIVFLSDHGDQLGDHHLFRKAYPYQGSIHIPFLVYDPGNFLKGEIHELNQIVELRDVLPSLVDFATGERVEGIDGISIKPCLTKADYQTRTYLHGEHSFGEDSNQWILTDEWKYIWYSISGKEQLFHLSSDPDECHDLHTINTKECQNLRQILIKELTEREEGFVVEGELKPVKQTKAILDFLKK